MKTVTLDRSEPEARWLAKAAFEEMDVVKAYHESPERILAKGVMQSQGPNERLRVTFEEGPMRGETAVNVECTFEIIGPTLEDPDAVERLFVDVVESLDDVVDELDPTRFEDSTKAVASESDLPTLAGTIKVPMLLSAASLLVLFVWWLWFLA
jgi:hypothetical protein